MFLANDLIQKSFIGGRFNFHTAFEKEILRTLPFVLEQTCNSDYLHALLLLPCQGYESMNENQLKNKNMT